MHKFPTVIFIYLFLSLSVHAEQYVCAYKCYFVEDELCQNIIQRTDDGFTGKYGFQYTVAEDERYIALSRPLAEPDGVAVFSLIIDKETLEFSRATTDMDGSGHRNGNCTLLP